MNSTDRPVLPWRIIAGAFLHFALPAYLLLGLACCAAGLLGGLTPSQLAAQALPYSVRFTALYLSLAALATTAAVVLDPPLRRRHRRRQHKPDAAQWRSCRNLADALVEGRSRLDHDAVPVLDAIAAAAWHHEEQVFQSMSADLAEVVRTSVAALATATPLRRQDLAAVTRAALTRIADRLRLLEEERSRLDEGDLRTVAGYIDGRYRPSDFTGDSVG